MKINVLKKNAGDGLAPAGRTAVVAIPLLLLALIGAAFWLRANGKIQLANILVWIPALPIAGVVALWGGIDKRCGYGPSIKSYPCMRHIINQAV